jgi:hypothetical protein
MTAANDSETSKMKSLTYSASEVDTSKKRNTIKPRGTTNESDSNRTRKPEQNYGGSRGGGLGSD